MALSEAEFEAIVKQLQEQSFADVRQAYGEEGFARWRNPKFNTPLPRSNVTGRLTGSCGDTIEIALLINNDRVQQAAYRTDGCASSQLCGSFTAELALGRSVEELFELDPDDVLGQIGTFPDQDRHCATLSINALQEAANDYLISQVRGIRAESSSATVPNRSASLRKR